MTFNTFSTRSFKTLGLYLPDNPTADVPHILRLMVAIWLFGMLMYNAFA
jgi:hypothetical protein